MAQNWWSWGWKLVLAGSLATGGVTAILEDCAFAQITRDTTLGTENSTVNSTGSVDQIKGGAARGTNLFHSFQEFNVGDGRSARFTSPAGIENILSRVTGANPSNILGTLGVSGGNANLFLINPNGITFGPNATLDVRGSFVASTASSLNFADGTQFSATAPQTTPLLTISVPIGLQLGPAVGSILMQGSSLAVQSGRTLALVGGDVVLEGSFVGAEEGRIELGSVAGPGLVNLNLTTKGWLLGYEDIQNFQNTRLSQQAVVDASGEGGGDIQVQGRHITVNNGSQVAAKTLGPNLGGSLTVNASESVEVTGEAPGGKDYSRLTTRTEDTGDAGNLTINTGELLIQDGAQVSAGTLNDFSTGNGGTLTVTAADLVEVSGLVTIPGDTVSSRLTTRTEGAGDAKHLTINTRKLVIRGGAQVSTGTVAFASENTGQGGNLTVNASDSVEVSGFGSAATERSALVSSRLTSRTETSSDGGNLSIITGELVIQDKADVSVNSRQGSGKAGNLEVVVRSILLDNNASHNARAASVNGGNITLQVQDLLLLRRNSNISATARTGGDGGNIGINTDLLVALENSDITANAFQGEGGRVAITAQGIFGTQAREQRTPKSDITATSELGPQFSGTVELNTPDVDSSSGLVNLSEKVVDVSGLVAQRCPAGRGSVARRASEFVVTGRGGLPPSPSDPPSSDAAQADWITLDPKMQKSRSKPAPATTPTSSSPALLVEAQGWVRNSSGKVVLTAQAPSNTSHSPGVASASCRGS